MSFAMSSKLLGFLLVSTVVDIANDMLAHLRESDVNETIHILAGHIFTEGEIRNSSRTGEKPSNQENFLDLL